jgi:hypothetical protein
METLTAQLQALWDQHWFEAAIVGLVTLWFFSMALLFGWKVQER